MAHSARAGDEPDYEPRVLGWFRGALPTSRRSRAGRLRGARDRAVSSGQSRWAAVFVTGRLDCAGYRVVPLRRRHAVVRRIASGSGRAPSTPNSDQIRAPGVLVAADRGTLVREEQILDQCL